MRLITHQVGIGPVMRNRPRGLYSSISVLKPLEIRTFFKGSYFSATCENIFTIYSLFKICLSANLQRQLIAYIFQRKRKMYQQFIQVF